MSQHISESHGDTHIDWTVAKPEEVERQRSFTERGPFPEQFLAFARNEILTAFPRDKSE